MVTMKRSRKLLLLITLGIGILIGIVGVVYIVNNPKTITEEKVVFHNTFQPDLTYEVHLKDNDIYDDTIQPEGAIYIKNILDYIVVDIGVTNRTSEVATIDMEYSLIASVIGFSTNNENRNDYWVKNFPLSDKKTVHIESDYLEKRETLKIYLDKYEKFAEEANKLAGLNLSNELKVSMTGNITVSTVHGEKEIPFDIPMLLPLQNNLIEITKGDLQPITDDMKEITEYTLPLNVKHIALLCTVIILFIVGFIFSILRIYEPLQEDMIRNEVYKILKNHGSRMVALQYSPNKKFKHTYEVSCIKDLLVLSDELQKPIYYVIDDKKLVKENSFYVEDACDIYIYKHVGVQDKNRNQDIGERARKAKEIQLHDVVDSIKQE